MFRDIPGSAGSLLPTDERSLWGNATAPETHKHLLCSNMSETTHVGVGLYFVRTMTGMDGCSNNVDLNTVVLLVRTALT